MVMSQNFPSFFDGIVAGDPVYDVKLIDLTGKWSVQRILNAYLAQVPPLQPITEFPSRLRRSARTHFGSGIPNLRSDFI